MTRGSEQLEIYFMEKSPNRISEDKLGKVPMFGIGKELKG